MATRARYAAGATLAAACSGRCCWRRPGCWPVAKALALGLLRLPAPRVSGRALASGQGAGQYRHRPAPGDVRQRQQLARAGAVSHRPFVGAREAMEVARLNLFDWDATSPLAYAAMMRTGQLADPIIARCQEWAAQHYEEEAPVSAMVRISGLPERTFPAPLRPGHRADAAGLHPHPASGGGQAIAGERRAVGGGDRLGGGLSGCGLFRPAVPARSA